MSFSFSYQVAFPYQPLVGFNGIFPILPFVVHLGDLAVTAVGILDTGSTYTILQPQIAEGLGITDLSSGRQENILSGGGSFVAYFFDVEIEVTIPGIEKTFGGQVGFTESPRPRNILGLNLVFQHYHIAFRDSAQMLYLSTE